VGDEAYDFDQVWREVGPVLWRAIVASAGGRSGIADGAVAEAFARAIERDHGRRPVRGTARYHHYEASGASSVEGGRQRDVLRGSSIAVKLPASCGQLLEVPLQYLVSLGIGPPSAAAAWRSSGVERSSFTSAMGGSSGLRTYLRTTSSSAGREPHGSEPDGLAAGRRRGCVGRRRRPVRSLGAQATFEASAT
jgi:hypothetical protein